MTLSDVMDGLAELTGMDNAYAWPVESISVPCALVDFPETVTFGLTFGTGKDTFLVPVWHIVGNVSAKAARNAMSDALTGVGSFKQKLEGSQSFADSVRVRDAEIGKVTVGAVTYIGIKFSTEVIG